MNQNTALRAADAPHLIEYFGAAGLCLKIEWGKIAYTAPTCPSHVVARARVRLAEMQIQRARVSK